MSVTLFRRHRKNCTGQHPDFSYTVEQEEKRRSWKPCQCKIWAHGTLNGVSYRLGTKCRDFASATEVLRPYVEAGRWDIDPLLPPTPPPPPTPSPSVETPALKSEKPGLAIADGMKDFLAVHKTNESSEGTISDYRSTLRELEAFAFKKGVPMVEDWDQTLVWSLIDEWVANGNKRSTVRKKLSTVQAFFEHWTEAKRIPFNPARIRFKRNKKERLARRAAKEKDRRTFSDADLRLMLEAADRLMARENAYAEAADPAKVVPIRRAVGTPRQYTGEDLVDFMNISLYTGMRISDIVLFDVSRLLPSGECHVKTTKNGEEIFVWIPEWLQARIRLRAARYGALIFGPYRTEKVTSMTEAWRRRLRDLWKEIGLYTETDRPTPHRFRHTFIRILLARGAEVPEVAEIVGDTEEVIRRHYTSWGAERQQALTARLKDAFGSRQHQA